MNKLFLALVLAGTSQAATIAPNHCGYLAPSGELCAPLHLSLFVPPGHPESSGVTGSSSYSANVIVVDGPESGTIMLLGGLFGQVYDDIYNGYFSHAGVSITFGAYTYVTYIFAPYNGDYSAGNITPSVIYETGVPIPLSITVFGDAGSGAPNGGLVNVDFHYGFDFFTLGVRPYLPPAFIEPTPHYGAIIADAIPEPSTFFTAGAMLGLLVTWARPSRSKKDG